MPPPPEDGFHADQFADLHAALEPSSQSSSMAAAAPPPGLGWAAPATAPAGPMHRLGPGGAGAPAPRIPSAHLAGAAAQAYDVLLLLLRTEGDEALQHARRTLFTVGDPGAHGDATPVPTPAAARVVGWADEAPGHARACVPWLARRCACLADELALLRQARRGGGRGGGGVARRDPTDWLHAGLLAAHLGDAAYARACLLACQASPHVGLAARVAGLTLDAADLAPVGFG